MDQKRVDLLIQYVLSFAAQGWGDYEDKEVGRIHIIKYVYLADLAYAMRHGGETFTGIPWRFHSFGPWDEGVFKRIDPACQAIGGHKRTITDTPYDDFDRWSVDDEHLMDQLDKQLPSVVVFAINGSFSQSDPLLQVIRRPCRHQGGGRVDEDHISLCPGFSGQDISGDLGIFFRISSQKIFGVRRFTEKLFGKNIVRSDKAVFEL